MLPHEVEQRLEQRPPAADIRSTATAPSRPRRHARRLTASPSRVSPQCYPYQERAVAALEAGATLLAAAPGPARLCIAIEFARRRRRPPLLVVCPAIAQGVWQAEVPSGGPRRAPSCCATWSPAPHVPDAPDLRGRVATTTWSRTRRAREVVAAARFDLGIVDESHACKSPDAQAHAPARTGRAAPAAACSTAVSASSCSRHPTPNGLPCELWPALRCFAPDLIDHLDYDPFTRRYCTFKLRQVQTRYGIKTIEQIAGASARAPELARAIAPFWHRPPREEIERDLPPLRMVTRRLPAELLDSRAIGKLEKSPEADQLRAAIEDGDLRGIEGQLPRLRRLLALAKVKADDRLGRGSARSGRAEGDRVGLAHRAARAAARRPGRPQAAPDRRQHAAARARRRRGRVPERPDAQGVHRPDPGRRSGDHAHRGAARRLPRAWPGRRRANFQALKRCHRIGQRWPVLGEALCAPGLDEAVQSSARAQGARHPDAGGGA